MQVYNVIWSKDWDLKYFMDNSTKMSFGKVIHDMYETNPKAWRIVHHVVCTLMGLHIIELHMKNVTKGNHRLFIVGSYEIWCNLYELSKMTCCELVDLIKSNFIKES
jgi:hypothetical protein